MKIYESEYTLQRPAPPTGPVASDEGLKTIGALNKPAEPKPVVILASASASSENARSREAKSGRLWTCVAAGAAVGSGAFFEMQANSTSTQVTFSSQ